MWCRLRYLSCMLTLCLCATAATSCAFADIPDFDNRGTIGNDDKLLAFIGRKIAISGFDPSEDDPKVEDDDAIVIHMDAAFKALTKCIEKAKARK